MEVAPLFVSIFNKRLQFFQELKLYKEGLKSKHDLNCDMVNLLHDYQDMVEEFERMLRDDEPKASPLPQLMEEALLFVRLGKKSSQDFLHELKLSREGCKSKHDLNCDMVDLLRELQVLVAEFESILADDEEPEHTIAVAAAAAPA